MKHFHEMNPSLSQQFCNPFPSRGSNLQSWQIETQHFTPRIR
jgi:hypothetical protein